MRILPATADDVVALRHAVLRAGLPRETAIFPGDDELSARHFVADDTGVIVGCVTLHLNQWQDEAAWQLRGMAVAPSHQRQGVGGKLIEAVEQSLRQSPDDVPRLLWCNARVPAAGFYERQGWEVVSDVFEIPGAGPHVKMIKRLRGVLKS